MALSESQVARRLDDLGVTLVNYQEPVTGDLYPALAWEDVAVVLSAYDHSVDQLRELLRGSRAERLSQAAALTDVWIAVDREGTGTYGVDPSIVAPAVRKALREARDPITPDDITDRMVNELALAIYGPAVVYDRERIRNGLAAALDAR